MQFNLSEIAAVIDAAKGTGYFEDQLAMAFTPFFDKLKKISSDTKPFDPKEVFKLDEKKFRNLKKRYGDVLEKFVSSLEERVSGSGEVVGGEKNLGGGKNKDVVKEPALNVMYGGKEQKKDKFKTERERDAIPVIIEGIDEKLIDFFKNANGGTVVTTSISKDEKDKESKKTGLLGWIAKIGFGVAAMAAGAALLFEGFMTNGPLKGTLKIIGSKLLKPALRMFTGLVDNVLIPVVKTGLGFVFDMITTPLKGIASIILKPITGLLDVFMKPIKGILSFVTEKLPGTKMLKSIGGFFSGILGKITGSMGKGMKLVFKNIPFLGSIISLGFAYSRFKNGDMVGGLLELASAIPFVGWGVNFFLAFRDMTMTREERQQQGSGLFEGIKRWFTENPFFKGLVSLFKGLYNLFTAGSSGEIDTAIDQIWNGGKEVLWLIPGLYVIKSTFDFFKKLVSGEFNVGERVTNVLGKIGDFGGWILDAIVGFFKTIGTKISNWIKNLLGSSFFKKLKLGVYSFINSIIDSIPLVPDWVKDKARLDTSSIEKELEQEEARNKKRLKEERVMEENRMGKDDKEQAKRHQESQELGIFNTNRIVEALGKNTEAVLTSGLLSQNNASKRSGDTTINNILVNTTERLRQSYYEKTYGTPTR